MYYHSSHVLLSILLTFCPVTHLLFASLGLSPDPWFCQLSVIHPVPMATGKIQIIWCESLLMFLCLFCLRPPNQLPLKLVSGFLLLSNKNLYFVSEYCLTLGQYSFVNHIEVSHTNILQNCG